MHMNYGERLKYARTTKGYTQQELAEKSGVKQGTISKIERGDQEYSAFDIDLASALDVSPAWLKNGKGNKSLTGSVDEPPQKYNNLELVATPEPVDFHIDYLTLEEALKQLDSELGGWHKLTHRRRARLIMSYYGDLIDEQRKRSEGNGETTSPGGATTTAGS